MSVLSKITKNDIKIQKFIDWDKCKNIFYNNIYLERQKIVIKMPLIPTEDVEDDMKIKKFDLSKYTFLISY
ncbi:MAG: hypothetical protein ACFFCC_15970 [Promethearchaeota archaeon]